MANFTSKALISFLFLASASVSVSASASENSAFTVVTNTKNNKHNYNSNNRIQTAPGPASVGTGTRTTSSSTSFLNVNSNSNNNDYGRNGSKTFVLKKPTGEVKYVMGSREKPQFRLGEFFKLSAVNGSSEGGDESASTTTTIPKPPTTPPTAAEVKETIKMGFFDELMGKGKEKESDDVVSSPVFAVSDPTPEKTVDDKFSMAQRIESIKTGVVGLLAGGLAITPFAALHDIVYPDDTIENSLAQWEFDTDTGSIAGALFAIVYRYCVREGEEKNEMLGMGVIGAFTIVRTLGRVRVGRYCDFAPLQCGEPLGYFDWDMLQQAFFSGLESAALFSLTAAAMDYCYKKGYISRFK